MSGVVLGGRELLSGLDMPGECQKKNYLKAGCRCVVVQNVPGGVGAGGRFAN